MVNTAKKATKTKSKKAQRPKTKTTLLIDSKLWRRTLIRAVNESEFVKERNASTIAEDALVAYLKTPIPKPKPKGGGHAR